MDATDLRESVVVILAAGCAVGRDLAQMVARAGARVVVVDSEEAEVNAIARLAPERIEALHLDVLNPSHCRIFCEAWGDEPLDLLIQCQPLRAPHRPGAAVQAIPAIAEGLAGGLARGRGCVVMLYRAAPEAAGAGQRALIHALEVLPGLMQGATWARGLRVTALRLPEAGDAQRGLRAAVRAVMARNPPFAPGVVLPLSPDAIDAGRSSVKPARDE